MPGAVHTSVIHPFLLKDVNFVVEERVNAVSALFSPVGAIEVVSVADVSVIA